MTTKTQKADIDRLAEVRAKLKAFTEEEKDIKERLKPLGVGIHKGTDFYAEIEECSRTDVDAKRLRAEDPKAFEKFKRTTDYIQISVKVRV